MTNKPKMLILSFAFFASDARALKQIALFGQDYELYTCGYGAQPDGVAGHFEIPADREHWRYNRVDILTRRFEKAYWANPAVSAAWGILQGQQFDVILANDDDTVGIALRLAPTSGVLADLPEYSPRQRDELLRWRLFFAPFVRWMCRHFVAQAAGMTTVGRGIADEYSRQFGFEPQVVTNATPYSELAPTPVGEPIRLVHSGAAMRNRDLMVMVDAVHNCAAPVTLDLYLTPNDSTYLAEIKAAVVGSSRVKVREPVAYHDLVATLNGYDVGVFVLAPINFNYEWVLPNKVFDYVQARLGLIVGPSPETAAMVIKHEVGAVATGFDAGALAAAIDSLSVTQVKGWKSMSDRSAHELSAESQDAVWAGMVARMVEQPTL